MLRDNIEIAEYILGTLDKASCEAMESEFDASSGKREEMLAVSRSLEMIALSEKPVQPGGRVRDLVLGALSTDACFNGFIDRLAVMFDLEKERIRELVNRLDAAPAAPWIRSGIPGVHTILFEGGARVAAATCGLVHIKAGTVFPAHQHQDNEWVFVLQGSAEEDSGRIFMPGDLVQCAAGSSHSFRTLGDKPFIFAVILFKKNKWLLWRTLIDKIMPERRFGRRRIQR